MKTIILILFIIISTNIPAQNNEIKKYKVISTGEYMTQDELNHFCEELRNQYTNYPELQINRMFSKMEESDGSHITAFTYEIKSGFKYLVTFHNDGIYKFLDKKLPPKTFLSIHNEKIPSHGNGKSTWINLWFTTCGGCIHEMPALNDLQEKYGERMNFLSLTFNEKEEIKEFLETHTFNFIHISDKEYLNKLGISAYPVNIYMDKEGIVRYVDIGLPTDGRGKLTEPEKYHQFLETLF